MYIGGSCTAIVTAVEPAAPIVAAPQLLSFFTRVESGAQLLSADVRVGGLGQSCKVVAMRPQHGGRAHHCYAGRRRRQRRTVGQSKFVGDTLVTDTEKQDGRTN